MTDQELKSELKKIHAASYGWSVQCCRGDQYLAKDILQTAYLKVLNKKAVFSEKSGFKTWFFAVIRNTSLDTFNKEVKLKQRNNEFAKSIETISQPIEINEKDDFFDKALTVLTNKQRELLHLMFYQEMTINQAAAVMNISGGSARQHYHRAKIQLKDWIVENKILES